METISILGCGWLGLPLAVRLTRKGWKVRGSTTSADKMELLESENIEPFLIDLNGSDLPKEFFQSVALVFCVPPRLRMQDADVFLKQVADVAQSAGSGLVRHLVYTSSTAVYPDLNGVVTEEDAPHDSPLTRAEKIFQKQGEFKTSVIRFAGLVGPGRHPGRFLAGKQVNGPRTPVNLIHLQDCLNILSAVVDHETGVDVLNACADAHPTKEDFYSKATREAGLPPPLFVERDKAPFKIVSNERLKRTLNYTFTFPDPMSMTFDQV
jgi:nucleoside-diphosphate-sugar epimerase